MAIDKLKNKFFAGSFITDVKHYFSKINEIIDWINNSVAAIGIGGSGTTNYISKFTASGTIGNSQIFDNGTNIGINNTSPTARLQITGVDATSSNYALKVENSASSPLLYVTNDGKVGIGTSSPTAKLHILSTSGSTDIFRAVSQYGTSLSVTQSGYVIADNGVHISDSNGLSFGSSSPFNKVIITPNDYQLNLGNTIILNDGGYATHFGADSSTLFSNSNKIWRWVDATIPKSYMSLTAVGLGIGDNLLSPTSKLQVVGSDATASNFALKVENSASSPLLYVRNDGVVIANNLPTSAAGLPSGAIWRNGNVLNIV